MIRHILFFSILLNTQHNYAMQHIPLLSRQHHARKLPLELQKSHQRFVCYGIMANISKSYIRNINIAYDLKTTCFKQLCTAKTSAQPYHHLATFHSTVSDLLTKRLLSPAESIQNLSLYIKHPHRELTELERMRTALILLLEREQNTEKELLTLQNEYQNLKSSPQKPDTNNQFSQTPGEIICLRKTTKSST